MIYAILTIWFFNQDALREVMKDFDEGYISDNLMKSITSRKTEQIDKHISWVKKLTEGGVFTKPKIEIDGRDVKSNLSYDKTNELIIF